jgi:hypothetical protein
MALKGKKSKFKQPAESQINKDQISLTQKNIFKTSQINQLWHPYSF